MIIVRYSVVGLDRRGRELKILSMALVIVGNALRYQYIRATALPSSTTIANTRYLLICPSLWIAVYFDQHRPWSSGVIGR